MFIAYLIGVIIMLCEKCKKNAATIFYQQIINGEKRENHICEECAVKMQNGVSFDTIFKGFLDSFIGMGSAGYTAKSSFSCPTCKLSFDAFKQTGKVGCADCYNAFKEQLVPVLKNIQGSIRHSGKLPKKAGAELYVKRELENLKNQLKRAVEKEEYEEAAKLRDKIRNLEGGGDNE